MIRHDPSKTAPVPSGRLTRLWHIGRAAGGLVGSATLRGLDAMRRGEGVHGAALAISGDDARRLTERLSRLRGAVMKLGQLMSLDGKDVLPPELVELLAPLRDGAHVMPFSQLVGVLDEEYGRDWKRHFRRFDFSPIAAASIGQVHRAQMREGSPGRTLAIKVQYPGVRESIDSDLDNLSWLLRLSGLLPPDFDLDAVLGELREQLHREADYRAEAEALLAYRERLGDDPSLLVPGIVPGLSTTRVLAMDLVPGSPVDRLADAATQGERDRVAELLSRLVLRELFEIGMVQTDPNYANFLYDATTGRIALLDFGAARAIDPELAEGYRRMARGAMHGDRAEIEAAAVAIGYLDAHAPRVHVDGLIDLTLLAAEPLCHRGRYDFGASTLLARAHELGRKLVYQDGFATTPPRETLFLHRKLVGTFMLCTRLRARFDVWALAKAWLG